ncbi:SLC13 family permease [Paenochrobactrum sp. BZR 588]|uniref:SLC13 family permease n=1 Tax=unclassified Paenochrobactrum TaxID=2639760 RepID=UPI0038526027
MPLFKIEASVAQADKKCFPFDRAGRLTLLITFLSLLSGIVFYSHLSWEQTVAVMLSVFCIGMWATSAVPEYLPAFVFFVIAIIFHAAPPDIVMGAFVSSTIWLLFGGMIVGSAIRYTGLGKRVAILLSACIGTTYTSVITTTVMFSMALSFFIPSSMGRIVLLVPIVISLAEHAGYSKTSNGMLGMLMAAAFGTNIPAYTILPANLPNMILAGAAENIYGIKIGYWNYLLLHFPVLGFIKACVLIALIIKLFAESTPPQIYEERTKSASMSVQEKWLTLIIVLSLLLWFTDGFHQVSPGWIALAGGVLCLWPGSGLVSPKCLNEEINYGTLFFVAGIMGLGALIAHSGLGTIVVATLSNFAGFEQGESLGNIVSMTIMAMIVATITNLPGIPAVMTPGAEQLSILSGLPIETVLMTQVLAFSSVVLPYQAPPLIAAAQIAGLPLRSVIKLCFILFMATIIFILPLDLLWWKLMGMF